MNVLPKIARRTPRNFGNKTFIPSESGDINQKISGQAGDFLMDIERVGGIEPPSTGWKPVVMPLYDTRSVGPGNNSRRYGWKIQTHLRQLDKLLTTYGKLLHYSENSVQRLWAA